VTPTLAVIGAINADLVVAGSRLPAPGETVPGGRFATHHGGKGGNQAAAAARALGIVPGGSGGIGIVVMIGAVGDDDLGADALDALDREGVTASVAVQEGIRTGVALIVVDEHGENQIAVAPGANARVSAAQVEGALDRLTPDVVLASLEVPEQAVLAAGAWCRSTSVPLVLNPAPEQHWLREVVPLAAYVTPNELELEALGDVPASVTVLETRGAGGVRIHDGVGGDPDVEVPAPRVDVIDTTGGGDCFNGVLAAGLLEGFELKHAVRRAVVAASVSVTRAGAREGMPTRAEIDAAMDDLRLD
jgi:ribokinase